MPNVYFIELHRVCYDNANIVKLLKDIEVTYKIVSIVTKRFNYTDITSNRSATDSKDVTAEERGPA